MTDYGRETSCTTGIRTGRFVSGAMLVGEALYRRLTTPRGSLRGGADEAEYGLDLTELIGSVATKRDAAALEGRIRSEALKDERIEDVAVTVVATKIGPATSFEISIVATTGAGPFTLQLGVTEVTASLLGLTEGS